jgi:fructokinase
MTQTDAKPVPFIFGEVLFDCFPNGDHVLGGAPFNVAWHLQALGDLPQFISRVGRDPLGKQIVGAMARWGMGTEAVQFDSEHPTGEVEITLIDDEPHYDITPDRAYDFIAADELPDPSRAAFLYHGSLALRNPISRKAWQALALEAEIPVFLDVNLRSPWWQAEDVLAWLKNARWAKLNHEELALMVEGVGDTEEAMWQLREQAGLHMLIVTAGEDGAVACTADGQVERIRPEPLEHFVDTVGAGDAFTSVLLHGLINEWPLAETMSRAQRFASRVVGMRGAIGHNLKLYQDI